MKCPYPMRIGAPGRRRLVPCGKCEACRNNNRYSKADRITGQARHTGFDRSWFVTLTYSDPHLPIRPAQADGEMNAVQAKFYEKLEQQHAKAYAKAVALSKRRPNSDAAREQLANDTAQLRRKMDECLELMDECMAPREPSPTLQYRDITLWVKRCEYRLGFTPKIVRVGEYGTARGRPHYHLCVFGVTREQVDQMLAEWKLCVPERKEAKAWDPAKAGGSYIGKDVTKGTAHGSWYLVRGLEPPKMILPKGRKTGMLADFEVERIATFLRKCQTYMSPLEFEQRVLINGLGRWYHDSDGIWKEHHRHAWKKALEQLTRDRRAQVDATLIRDKLAYYVAEATDPNSPEYDREIGEGHEAQLRRAKLRLEKAQRKHEKLLRRKASGL